MKSGRFWKILNFLGFSVCLPRMHLSSGQFLLPWLLLLSPIIALDTTLLKIALGLPQRPLLISPTVPAQKSFWSRKALLFTGQGRIQYDRDAQCVWQSFPSMHSFDNVSLLFSHFTPRDAHCWQWASKIQNQNSDQSKSLFNTCYWWNRMCSMCGI